MTLKESGERRERRGEREHLVCPALWCVGVMVGQKCAWATNYMDNYILRGFLLECCKISSGGSECLGDITEPLLQVWGMQSSTQPPHCNIFLRASPSDSSIDSDSGENLMVKHRW